MSAKKITERRANDDYQTPLHVVEPLLDLIDWSRPLTWLEPCAGDGHIVRMVEGRWQIEAAIEGGTQPMLLTETCEIRDGSDYLTYTPPCEIDLIVTNPPFALALEFLRKSIDEAATVCYLLPLGFLSSTERHDFWRAHPPTNLITLSARPCFVWVCRDKTCKGSAPPQSTNCPTCDGPMKRQTDFSDVGWFVWDRGRLLKTRAAFVWI